MILSLPKRSILSSDGYDCLLKILHSEEDILVKFVAARSLAEANSQRSAEVIIPIFLQAIEEAEPLVNAYKEIAVSGCDAIDEICINLSVIGKNQASNIIPVLVTVLDKYRSYHASMIAHALLCLVFKGDLSHGGVSFQQLNASINFQQLNVEQQKVLQSIAASTKAWRYNMNMAETMSYFNLPNSKEAFMKFCDVS